MVKYPTLLANLFSSSFVEKVITQQHIPYLKLVLKETNFKDKIKKNSSLSTALQNVYGYLKDNYRCEYVFKTAILQELLLKRHDLYSSTYLTEFKAYNAKADILILNGTSTVYEIKSDIDNFNRILNQTSVYQKMFDKVFVVSNDQNIKKLQEILPTGIGIIVLHKNSIFETIRESKSNIEDIDKALIFDSLRKTEYLPLIKSVFGYTPNVPGTIIHKHCKEMFLSLSNEDAHRSFMNALKSRKLSDEQIKLINKVNLSVKGVLAEKYYSKFECNNINFALNQKIPL